jgi:hypothetical protein
MICSYWIFVAFKCITISSGVSCDFDYSSECTRSRYSKQVSVSWSLLASPGVLLSQVLYPLLDT